MVALVLFTPLAYLEARTSSDLVLKVCFTTSGCCLEREGDLFNEFMADLMGRCSSCSASITIVYKLWCRSSVPGVSIAGTRARDERGYRRAEASAVHASEASSVSPRAG